MKILVTGGCGFIGSYLCHELLNHGYEVVSIDNFSKYGRIDRSYFKDPKFSLISGDCKDLDLITKASEGCDMIVAGAAKIGGISYFHKYAYDLMAENERILASTFDAAIKHFTTGRLVRIVVLSSSMVFENSSLFPTPESEVYRSPPPTSTYGFQKLAAEYFAKGAFEQYKLPYTIIRPFNCVGVGEGRALGEEIMTSGNISLALSHVLPDLAQKVVRGQWPLKILGDGSQVRCYTHGSDIARGIRLAIESTAAVNNDFNISTNRQTTVLELAQLVWKHFHAEESFQYESDAPYEYDVQYRVPDTTKAKLALSFESLVSLEESVSEVCEWVRGAVVRGEI
jgi:UDP-glucose 4-epimerase